MVVEDTSVPSIFLVVDLSVAVSIVEVDLVVNIVVSVVVRVLVVDVVASIFVVDIVVGVVVDLVVGVLVDVVVGVVDGVVVVKVVDEVVGIEFIARAESVTATVTSTRVPLYFSTRMQGKRSIVCSTVIPHSSGLIF